MPSAVVRKPLERITKYHRLNHDTLDVKIRDSGFTNAAVAEARLGSVRSMCASCEKRTPISTSNFSPRSWNSLTFPTRS